MFSCYLKLGKIQTPKKNGTERKTPTYIAVAQAGYFKPLQAIRNAKNEIIMYYQRNDKCNKNSTAETRLQCKGSINFSSIYFKNLKIGEINIGCGEPPAMEYFKNRKRNPFFESKEDGYLFLIAPDLQTIEILIVPNSRHYIEGIAKKLADGKFDDALNQMRDTAKPM